MKKILFVSSKAQGTLPIVESVFNEMLAKKNLENVFLAESARVASSAKRDTGYASATVFFSRKENAYTAHEPSRQLVWGDYDRYEKIVCMDMDSLIRTGITMTGDPGGKISTLLKYDGREGEDIATPSCPGDFDAVRKDITSGCEALLRYLIMANVV